MSAMLAAAANDSTHLGDSGLGTGGEAGDRRGNYGVRAARHPTGGAQLVALGLETGEVNPMGSGAWPAFGPEGELAFIVDAPGDGQQPEIVVRQALGGPLLHGGRRGSVHGSHAGVTLTPPYGAD